VGFSNTRLETRVINKIELNHEHEQTGDEGKIVDQLGDKDV
jgi:hypothetical protein